MSDPPTVLGLVVHDRRARAARLAERLDKQRVVWVDGAHLPRDVVLRIPRDDIVRHLSATLVRLIDDPAEIARLARETHALAARVLESWDARIAREIDLITGSADTAT